MWPGNFAPNDANLGSANFLLAPVDISDFLAQIEVGSRSVVNALDLDQAGAGVSSMK